MVCARRPWWATRKRMCGLLECQQRPPTASRATVAQLTSSRHSPVDYASFALRVFVDVSVRLTCSHRLDFAISCAFRRWDTSIRL
jgi:hypothetical protein